MDSFKTSCDIRARHVKTLLENIHCKQNCNFITTCFNKKLILSLSFGM